MASLLKRFERPKPDAKELADAWNVRVEDVKTAQRKTNNLHEIFLLSKGITESKFQTLYYQAAEEKALTFARPSRFKSLPFLRWWTSNTHDVAKAAQFTLDQLLHPVSIVTSEVPFDMSFANYIQSNPLWDQSECSFVFFRDHPKIQKTPPVLIQRKQLSGNCYIHGPIVALYYIRRMHDIEADAIDIRTFILRDLDKDHLAKLITHVGGGSSRQIFQNLIGPNATLIVTGFSSIQNDIKNHLIKYGPGLVTGFQIEKSFQTDIGYHHGSFSGDVIGSHSMVVIGFRHDEETKQQFILLQNWWGRKQFVECDTDYFAASGATILFCKGEIAKQHHVMSNKIYDEGDFDHDDQLPDETRINVT